LKLRYYFIPSLLVSLFILFHGLAYGVEEPSDKTTIKNNLLTESAFITGFGVSQIEEGHYQPILLIWHLGIDLKKYFPIMRNLRGDFLAYIEPQFNPAINSEMNFEFGVDLGVKYITPPLIKDKLSAYILAGTGPHYISVVTRDQANGLIFSNTIGAGLYLFLTENSAINFGYRLRHISNAGLTEPNSGINTHFGIIGCSVFF